MMHNYCSAFEIHGSCSYFKILKLLPLAFHILYNGQSSRQEQIVHIFLHDQVTRSKAEHPCICKFIKAYRSKEKILIFFIIFKRELSHERSEHE